MIKTMSTPSDLWTMRKQFGLQISSATFMTYIMCLSARYPSRFHISRKTGLIHVSEMLPCESEPILYMILLLIGPSSLIPSTACIRKSRRCSISAHPEHAVFSHTNWGGGVTYSGTNVHRKVINRARGLSMYSRLLCNGADLLSLRWISNCLYF